MVTPDIGSAASGLMTSATQATQTLSYYTFITLIIAIFAGALWFIIYKRSFKVKVMIVKSTNGIDFTTDLKGKFFLKGKNTNEYRFKIWAAKKHKLLYNEENISPKFIYNSINAATGKNEQFVILSPNSEGFLCPIELKPQEFIQTIEEKDTASGNRITRVKKTTVLQADYGPVDVSWLQGEATKFRELFDTRGFLDKWGTIIILIGMVLVAGALLYCAYKFAAASANMSLVLQNQGELLQAILQAQNNTAKIMGQPLNTIIAG